MAERQPPDGGKDGKRTMSQTSRTLMFWLLLVLLPLAIYQLMSASRQEFTEIPFSEFSRQLERDNIASIEITRGEFIKGEFKGAITARDRRVESFRTVLPIRDSEMILQRIEAKQVPILAKEPNTPFGTLFLQWLPILLIIGLWLFFFRQIQAGGNRAFSFGKSKAKLLTADTPKVTFADVAGADEAKLELEEIVEFLKDPQRFQRLGGRLPKGVLLVGPPGTGKTLLARAIAGEAGRPFFSMSGSDFVEMFVGVGASRVRDLFEQGKAHAPCIIFIDEIDAVGRHRGAGLGGGHDEREQTLNQLLVEMDGFASNEGVILIAATNRPDVLDPALLRPGRFDRQVVVDMPDVRGREMILKVHAREKPLSRDVNLTTIAKATPGMAGADLANIVNEAALLAARRGKPHVEMQDFEDAKDKVMLGVERKSMVLTDEEKKLTAYHEAGHAIVSVRMPGLDPIHKVSIVPRGQALGITFSLPDQDRHNYTKEYIRGKLAMMYGGRVAEEIIFGADKVTTGAAQDIIQATELARRMVTQFGMSDAIGPIAVGDREHQVFLGREISHRHEVSEKTAELVDAEVKRILDEALRRARDTLHADMDLLHRIATALLDRETLDRDDIVTLVDGRDLPPKPPAVLPTPPTTPVLKPDSAAAGRPALATPPEPAGA